MNILSFIIVIKDILRSRSMAGATLTLLLLATLPQPAQAYDNVSDFTPTTTVGSSVPVETLYAVCDPSSSEQSVTVSAFSVLDVSLESWYNCVNTCYMRWFVVDADATDYTASSVTASTSGWDIQPTAPTSSYSGFNIYGAGENHQYGVVADCIGQIGTTDYDTVFGCTYTIPSGTDVSNYKLVCFISYKGTNEGSYVQTSTDREITAVAEFQLVTSADDLPFTAGSTASIGKANTAEVMTVVDASTSQATVNAYSEVYDTNTSSFNLGLTSPYYIRWYMENVATGEVIDDNDTSNYLFATSTFSQYDWGGSKLSASNYYSHRNCFYMTYPQTDFAFTSDNWGTTTTSLRILKAALDGMRVTYVSGLTNVRVHCLLSTTEPTTASEYVVAEPDFDAEVIFYFKTKEQIEAEYTASDANEDGASEKAITKVLVGAATSTDDTYVVTSDHWSKSGDDITITYDSLAVAADLGVLESYADKIYYMRWVELDANGDPVKNSGLFSNLESNISEYTGSATYHYNESTGYHIIYSISSNEHFSVSKLIEELNKKVTLTNFDATHSIEFVLSTTMPGLTTDSGGDYVLYSEPPYDLKITYNYLHADDVATYFYPAESTAMTTLTQTQVISASEESASKTTINAYTDLSSDLSSVTAKYIRWCVLDADGNIITSYSGFSADDYSETDCFVNKTKDGTVYTITSDTGLTLSSVLNNMSVGVPLVSGSNSGYKVVALIASSTPQTYYDTETNAYVLNEPAFDVKIEYTLLTASDIEEQYKAALTDASATYTLNSSVSMSSAISINAYTLADGTDYNWTKYSYYITNSTYVRWYITDASGNIIDATGLFSNSVADSYYQDWGGTYVCSNVSSTSTDDNYISNLLNNITVNGSTLGKGYQIICLVSTDTDGATTIGGYVSEEPSSYTLKIVYTISNDGTFHHYIGYEFDSLGYSDNESTGDEAYLKVNGGIRQQTNEWTYYRYVEPGDIIQLINRFDKVKETSGEPLEPQGYFRWYDYNTDYASDCLSTSSSFGSMLNLEFYEDGYGYRGLFSYANSKDDLATAANYAAVNFTAPKDAGWEETIIACDVSKYVDGIVEDTSNPAVVFQHEPTLSMRYKFIVRPNTTIAKYLKDALIEDHVPYEDNKYLTFGLKSNGNGTGQVRTELQRTSDYWFYPCTAPDSAYCDDSYAFTESQFATNAPVQAQAVMWRAYYNDEAYVDLNAVTCSFDNSSFAHQQALDLSTLGSNLSWKDMKGNSATVPKAVIGSSYELIAFAIDGTGTSSYSQKCPIARYIVRFLSEAPEPFDSLDTYRTIDYLEETYTRQAVISFDNYEGSNLSLPETVLINGNSNAYGIDDMTYSAYGYCYPGLYKYGWQYASGTMTGYNMGLSPLHGDYVLLKSMNLSGVSTSETTLTGTDGNSYMYRWWHTSSELRDRTYLDYSNGAQAGYFLYIDAAEEARPIVSVPFEADLCTGSCLVFSAAVTDMTSQSTAPQLMFELFGLDTDDEGNETARHPIHKFNTCDFSTVCKNTKGTWYQVYGKVYLQKAAAVENYSNFLVQITNYANNTQGADYAVDDIRFYTQNAKIEVTQSNAICGESGAILKMKIAYNTLLALIDDLASSSNKHFILYKICNEDGSDYTDITFPVTGTYCSILEINKLVYQTDGQGNYEYDSNGLIALDSSCVAQYNSGTLSVPGYEYDSDGTLYYVFANNDFNLPAGKTFYISAASEIFEQGTQNNYITYDIKNGTYTLNTNANLNALEWGSPSTACSLYSNMFTPAQQSVLVIDADGETVTQVSFDCTNASNISPTTLSAQIKIPTSSGTFVTYPASSTDGLRIDWIITSAEGYAKLTEEVNGTTLLDSLDTALAAFREDCPNATSLSSWTTSGTNYTADRYNLLNSYIGGTTTPDTATATVYAKVFLTQTYTLTTSELDLQVNNTYYLIARAYATGADGDTSLTVDGTAYDLCSDLMMTTLSTIYTGPELAIGFDDVVYPSSRDANIGNVRLGLFHLDDMKNNGAHLHVPVNSISNSSSYTGTASQLTADASLTLASTTDPLAESYVGQTVGWLGQTTIGTSSSNKFVDILFKSGDNTTPLTFHEGYEYELCVLFADYGQSISATNLCTGNAYITLKVVPEYVTWTGAQATNTNWNNDANWTRSTKEELYKTGTGNYTDDSEIFSTVSVYAQPQTYVPLKFTKATIPSGAAQWPYLASVSVDHNTGIAESLINRDGSAATSLIEYDMVAKVDQGCDHSGTSGTIYDCEKFYANTCDQIYFKPRTQLLLQHYLTYNYAWVEQQLASGEWYILGAPLKDTYAGDMYAPANSSFLGKQETQAFEPITFNYCSYNSTSSASDTIYNRSTYPIYQRSWDKSVSKEVTPTGDSRGEYYDAFRKSATASSGTELDGYSATELQWSHTYNDVTEKYTNGLGYSLRAYNKTVYADQGKTYIDSALIRLPKADKEYTYYFYDDYKDTDNGSGTVSKENYGRFATNATDASDGSYTTTGLIYATPDALQSGGDYYLLSNPYMSSLYVSAFLTRNTMFDSSKIWYVSSGAIKGVTVDNSTKLGPMQAFFVKKADGETIDSSTQVTYTLTMTLSSSVASTASMASLLSKQMQITVESSNGKSTVAIVLDDDADSDFFDDEDIETLFDTNLSDRPTLYTVAGSQTVLLNRTDAIGYIPLGVVEDEDEELTLTVSGTENLGTTLYLVDAVDGVSTELTDDATVTLRSNDHGRYFITSELFSPDGEEEYANAIRCYSPQPGTIVCTSATGDNLQDITVYTSSGMTVTNLQSVDNVSATINVGSRGVYVVRLTTDNAPNGVSVKVVVK